jgi:hypothetical protein
MRAYFATAVSQTGAVRDYGHKANSSHASHEDLRTCCLASKRLSAAFHGLLQGPPQRSRKARGTVMFGRQTDGSEQPAAMDLVRLAIPRRTYTQSHIAYVIEVCTEVCHRAPNLRGSRIVDEPETLRHFTARFEPIR